MKKDEFIRLFVVQFCASWCAANYNDACSDDRHELLHSPPVEDAAFLAEKAWNECVDKISEIGLWT